MIFIDEFQIEDVADAMIITNILEKILDQGLKIIITSNAHPDDFIKMDCKDKSLLNLCRLVQRN